MSDGKPILVITLNREEKIEVVTPDGHVVTLMLGNNQPKGKYRSRIIFKCDKAIKVNRKPRAEDEQWLGKDEHKDD